MVTAKLFNLFKDKANIGKGLRCYNKYYYMLIFNNIYI